MSLLRVLNICTIVVGTKLSDSNTGNNLANDDGIENSGSYVGLNKIGFNNSKGFGSRLYNRQLY